MITLFRTDTTAFPSDAYISHMFRGAQLLLVNQEMNSPTNIENVIRSFSEESKNVQDNVMCSMTNLMVYSKLMLQNSKAKIGTNFTGIIEALDTLLEDENSILPNGTLSGLESCHKENESIIGFMFLNQTRQLSKIKDLKTIFNFLDEASPELRARLLSPLERDDTDVDMLVSAAWLSEHKNNTIDSTIHSDIFRQLENKAVKWNHKELSVSCRKFQAIILDEYGEKYKKMFAYAKNIFSVSNPMTKKMIELGCDPNKIIKNTYGPGDHFFEVKPDYSKNTIVALGGFVNQKAPYFTIMALSNSLMIKVTQLLNFKCPMKVRIYSDTGNTLPPS